MGKVFDKLLKKSEEKKQAARDIISEKLKGDSYLYAGDPCFDWGNGGWTLSTLNLLYGPSKSGKTTLAWKALGEIQQKYDGYVVILDSEKSTKDPDERKPNGELTDAAVNQRERWAKAGIDPDRVWRHFSNVAGELFEVLADFEAALEDDPKCISAILIDSWEGIQSKLARKKLEEGYDEKKKKGADAAGELVGGNAKVINPIVKSLLRISAKFGVTVFGIQHVRCNLDQYGQEYVLPGGQTFVHLHENIMFIEGGEFKKDALMFGDVAGKSTDDMAGKVGKLVKFRCEKTRNTIEGKQGSFWFNFNTLQFARPEDSLVDLATRLGVIAPVAGKAAGWLQFPAGAKNAIEWYGKPKVIDALQSDPELFKEVYQECRRSGGMSATTETVGKTVDENGKLWSTIIQENKESKGNDQEE